MIDDSIDIFIRFKALKLFWAKTVGRMLLKSISRHAWPRVNLALLKTPLCWPLNKATCICKMDKDPPLKKIAFCVLMDIGPFMCSAGGNHFCCFWHGIPINFINWITLGDKSVQRRHKARTRSAAATTCPLKAPTMKHGENHTAEKAKNINRVATQEQSFNYVKCIEPTSHNPSYMKICMETKLTPISIPYSSRSKAREGPTLWSEVSRMWPYSTAHPENRPKYHKWTQVWLWGEFEICTNGTHHLFNEQSLASQASHTMTVS